jgi:hypothetical protein
MDVVSQDNSGASVRFTYDELAIVYGALVEAMEALSHEEFSARACAGSRLAVRGIPRRRVRIPGRA